MTNLNHYKILLTCLIVYFQILFVYQHIVQWMYEFVLVYHNLRKQFKDPYSIQFCNYNQFLGIIPIEISDVFPSSHYVMVRNDFDPEDFPLFKETWEKFFEKNKFDKVYLSKNDPFLQYFKKFIPKHVKRKSIQWIIYLWYN